MQKNPLIWLRDKVYELAAPSVKDPIGQAIATVQNDPTAIGVSFANYLLPKDWILNEKGGGNLQIYRRVMMDDQAAACFTQRVKAVTSKPWKVIAGDDRRQSRLMAEFITDQLKNVVNTANPNYANTSVGQDGIEGICDQMFFALAYDFAIAEIHWREVSWQGKSYMGLPAITIWDQERFNFSPNLELQLKTWQNPLGQPVDPARFWLCLHSNLVSTYPPLAHFLYWVVLFKTQGFKFWMTFLDAFGNPTKVGKYPLETSDEEQKKLKAALKSLSQNTSVVVPEGMIVELLEATRSGTADYESLINQMNGAIAKLVLGQTQTTDGGSSYAQSNTHMQVRTEITTSDARWMASSINRGLVKPLYDFNIDGFAGAEMPHFEWELEESEDINIRAERDKKLFDMGYRLTEEELLAVYGDGYVFPVGQVLLNGAQLQSMVELLKEASVGNIPTESLGKILEVSFGFSPEIANEIVAPLRNAPKPQNIAPNPSVPSPNTQIPTQGTQNVLAAQNPQAPLIVRGGEIYQFVGKVQEDTVTQLTENFLPTLGDHSAKWQKRLELAYQESSDYTELQERIVGIFEGMAKEREKLASEYAKADRTAYLAGIAEAEGDAN